MSSEKRPAGGLTRKQGVRGPVASVIARRCAPAGALTRRLLLPAVLSLALAGCSVIPGTAAWSRKQTLSPTRPSVHRREARQKKSFLGSWFPAEEPEPLKTTNDWMALEQIRP
jgi:hypothetical protein